MKFDLEITSNYKENIEIKYGIINGNNKIVLIKAGQDGSNYGYENKYLKMAINLNNKFGCTVITSSNPFDGTNPLDNDLKIIDDYCKNNKLKNYEIYFVGLSNGAMIGLIWGYQYSKIKKMLLINSPIFINWHKIKNGLKNNKNQKIYLIYGEYDQSIKYIELYNPLLNNDIILNIIKGADHNFTNMMDEFVSLPEKYLFEK